MSEALVHDTIALSVERLSFAFGARHALDCVGFQLAAGETAILLGPNGAGKTTLFSLICGLFSAREGRLSIGGHDIAKHPVAALQHLGIVFQAQTLDLDLTVRQNLRYYCALRGLSRSDADRRMEAELERLGMAERIGEKVRGLNGGHRRRVEIARALLHEPKLLLLDEPTIGLDIPTRRALIDRLHEIGREKGIALLWSTHLIDEISDSDRIIVLDQGKIAADGTSAELKARTATGCLDAAYRRLTRNTVFDAA